MVQSGQEFRSPDLTLYCLPAAENCQGPTHARRTSPRDPCDQEIHSKSSHLDTADPTSKWWLLMTARGTKRRRLRNPTSKVRDHLYLFMHYGSSTHKIYRTLARAPLVSGLFHLISVITNLSPPSKPSRAQDYSRISAHSQATRPLCNLEDDCIG